MDTLTSGFTSGLFLRASVTQWNERSEIVLFFLLQFLMNQLIGSDGQMCIYSAPSYN